MLKIKECRSGVIRKGIAAAILTIGACSWGLAAPKKKHVAIIRTSAPRYNVATTDLENMLKEGGITDKADVSVEVLEVHGANQDPDKAKFDTLIAKLQAQDTDAYIPVGTAMTRDVMARVKDKPIVFHFVFDPIKPGFIKDWSSSGNNVTGGSNQVELEKFVLRLSTFLPMKKVAILYIPGNLQSEVQMSKIKTGAQRAQVDVVLIAFKGNQDLPSLSKQFDQHLDVLFFAGGDAIEKNISDILETSNKLKILTATQVDAFVDAGVLLGLMADTREVGRVVAKNLTRVLNGEPPSSVPSEATIPILVFNEKAAKAQGFVPPVNMKKWVTKTIK